MRGPEKHIIRVMLGSSGFTDPSLMSGNEDCAHEEVDKLTRVCSCKSGLCGTDLLSGYAGAPIEQRDIDGIYAVLKIREYCRAV